MALWIQNISHDFGSRPNDDLHDYAVRVNNDPPLATFRHVRALGAAACLRAAADAIEAREGLNETATARSAADEIEALRKFIRDTLLEPVIRAGLGFRQAEAILNPHLMEKDNG